MTLPFDALEEALRASGPAAMVDHLCRSLRERGDRRALFQALVLRTRLRLGLPATAPGSSEPIPDRVQGEYAAGLRDAALTVGELCLQAGEIAEAWPFFRMVGEPAKVAEAIAAYQPRDPEQCRRVVEVALQEGVNPAAGFDLVLGQYGVCTAVTLLGQDLVRAPDVRAYCIGRLVRAVHGQLAERLTSEILAREGGPRPPASVRECIDGRDWLFADDACHVDPAHLAGTVALASELPAGPELDQAIELSEYGTRLSPRLRAPGDPPFPDHYRDYRVLLRALAGLDAEDGVAHFRAQLTAAGSPEAATAAAEVLVILLSRLQRHREALEVFAARLAGAAPARLDCPGLEELCRRAADYRPLLELSRLRGDLVSFATGLVQARSAGAPQVAPARGIP
jgi:hypothetical protein